MKSGLVAQRIAKRMTRWVGLYWGESFPFYYVSEHPKSGGSWLARMVSDYLQLPFPQYVRLPIAFRSVILNHWQYDPRMRRVFYLYRDGRDVMVSMYFHHLRMLRTAQNSRPRRIERTYERLFGKNFDPDDVVRHLPRFVEHEFAHPGRGTPLNWRDHVQDWLRAEGSGSVTYLSYEELQRDCGATLGKALESMTGEAVDPWRLETTVEKMSMKRQTGRDPGGGDRTQHARKGIVGDWKNYFSQEAAERFNELAGDLLVQLGYERDRSWVERYTYPTS